MTLTREGADAPPVPEGYVRLTIDDRVVDAPKGELIIRTCERLGIIVPRFCDHPLLDPAGACRQCLVEVEMGGRPMPKPQASCTMTVADGMVVRTQHTSKVADKAQQGVMELLLINHPLDCPVCDKGGECPLQNQAMSSGRTESRFVDTKRTFAKPIPISTQVLLDRERCVLCQRCTRFSEQIAGDPFIELLERGAQQQIGVAEDKPFQSYFSGNTIQICPVGALTSAAYRFRSRPFDLVSTPTVCEHCACGSAMRTDTRRGVVLRRMAGNDPAVNEEWIDDKSRFAFRYLTSPDRITRPMVRQPDGTLAETSWTEALSVAARGLLAAREGGIGVLAGGRLTVEDAYAYGKFARVAAGTNDVDFRRRWTTRAWKRRRQCSASRWSRRRRRRSSTCASAARCASTARTSTTSGSGPRPPWSAPRRPPVRRRPRPRTTSSRSCRAPRPRCSATCPRPCSSGSRGAGWCWSVSAPRRCRACTRRCPRWPSARAR
jgi:NADH-quinone oxidoreductase subunit G